MSRTNFICQRYKSQSWAKKISNRPISYVDIFGKCMLDRALQISVFFIAIVIKNLQIINVIKNVILKFTY